MIRYLDHWATAARVDLTMNSDKGSQSILRETSVDHNCTSSKLFCRHNEAFAYLFARILSPDSVENRVSFSELISFAYLRLHSLCT
ncbi:hypothetical protein TNCV_3599931 [Trichonephila clavipes]|nr:hypothetical protein TNCV_3599931 [Trichonephila clavipes]